MPAAINVTNTAQLQTVALFPTGYFLIGGNGFELFFGLGVSLQLTLSHAQNACMKLSPGDDAFQSGAG